MNTKRNISVTLSEADWQVIIRALNALNAFISQIKHPGWHAWYRDVITIIGDAIRQLESPDAASPPPVESKRRESTRRADGNSAIYKYKRPSEVSRERFNDGSWIDEVPDWMPPDMWLDE